MLCPLGPQTGGVRPRDCDIPLVCATSPTTVDEVFADRQRLNGRSPQPTFAKSSRGISPLAYSLFAIVIRSRMSDGSFGLTQRLGVRPLPRSVCGTPGCGPHGWCEWQRGEDSTTSAVRCRCFPGYVPRCPSQPLHGVCPSVFEESGDVANHLPKRHISSGQHLLSWAPVPRKAYNEEWPQPCPKGCRGRGHCDGMGFCRCTPGWWGLDCGLFLDAVSGRRRCAGGPGPA
mmetsp:Transcript_8645/g.29486  ORF Transcript_8645/g.29486 Transcript_8645/m.29486 type:complete len:230 (-) Transcript_8645:331-1020(-)